MTPETPDAAPETRVATRRWRLWASAAIAGFTVVAVVIGFFVLSSRDGGIQGALGHHRNDTTAAGAAVVATPPPTAVAWTAATLALLAGADVSAGRALAQTCVGCHGVNGIAVAAGSPNLAGQHATAIYKQLHDYAGGQRSNAIMASMASTLDDRKMANLAAYFASFETAPRAGPSQVTDAIIDLANNGDPVRGIPPCESCHAARGGPQGIPLLDGQPAPYLQQQIEAFASGVRGNDIYGVMREVARLLTPAEIEQLARYYGL